MSKYYRTLLNTLGGEGEKISKTGLLAYYNLNNNGNDYFSNYNMTPTGVTYETGKFNKGMKFNGGYLENTSFTNTLPLTVGYWFYITDSDFVSNIGYRAHPSLYAGIEFSVSNESSKPWNATVRTGRLTGTSPSARKTYIYELPNSLTLNTWHYVCFINYSMGDSDVYVNGVKINLSQTTGSANTIVYDNYTNIGRMRGVASPDRNGKNVIVDEVCIWGRALTSNEAELIRTSNTPLSDILI